MVSPIETKTPKSDLAPCAAAVTNESNPSAAQAPDSKASADESMDPSSIKPSAGSSEGEEARPAQADGSIDISNNLKLPSLPSSSSSSSEDIYDMFSPPVNKNIRSKPRKMTVVTAADSVLKDEEGVVLPSFRDQVS